MCALVPITNCYDVPKEVCNNDPITTCNQVPKQNCNDVEENVCVDVVTNNCEQIETSCQFVKRYVTFNYYSFAYRLMIMRSA